MANSQYWNITIYITPPIRPKSWFAGATQSACVYRDLQKQLTFLQKSFSQESINVCSSTTPFHAITVGEELVVYKYTMCQSTFKTEDTLMTVCIRVENRLKTHHFRIDLVLCQKRPNPQKSYV